MKSFKLNCFFIFLFSTIIQTVYADRLKDMVSFAGIRSNQLMGYGIVVGLDGTGDSSLAVTLQSMQSTISQFGMNVDASSLSGKNSAAVMITADLDPFTKVGQKIFDDKNGIDPYLEDDSTIWLLHWLLCSNPRATIFYYFFDSMPLYFKFCVGQPAFTNQI